MKHVLSVLVISSLAVACGSKKSGKDAEALNITTDEVMEMGTFIKPFESKGNEDYSPLTMIQVDGNLIHRTSVHPSQQNHAMAGSGSFKVDETALRIEEVFEYQKGAKSFHLTKRISVTECKGLNMVDETPLTLGFQRAGKDEFSLVSNKGQLSGMTRATQEQYEAIKKVPLCSTETKTDVSADKAVPAADVNSSATVNGAENNLEIEKLPKSSNDDQE